MSATENERLPYDIGSEAYVKRIHYRENPYPESDWKHDEWYLGWSHQQESETNWDWVSDDYIKE